MRYDCADPSVWPTYRFPENWQILHDETSPTTPFAIPEFQGGSGTGWGPGSVNQDGCNALVNEESVRILYKNNYSFGVKLLNICMNIEVLVGPVTRTHADLSLRFSDRHDLRRHKLG